MTQLFQKSSSQGDMTVFELFLVGGIVVGVIAAIISFERGYRKSLFNTPREWLVAKFTAAITPALEDKRRWRHPADLRIFDPALSSTGWFCAVVMDAAGGRCSESRVTGATTPVYRPDHLLLLLLYGGDI